MFYLEYVQWPLDLMRGQLAVMTELIIEISALGQLYDAKTSILLLGFCLYKTESAKKKTLKTTVESTKFWLNEIKNIPDHAKSLDISAQLSVSILRGAVTICRGGSYLNKQQDTSDPYTVAAIARFRKRNKSLDLFELQHDTTLSAEMLAKPGATHVVTSLTYGANIVGALTEKSTNKEDSTEVKGNFSLEAFKGLGKANLSTVEKVKIKSYNIGVELVTDIPLGETKLPTEPVAILELIVKSPPLVGTGVPATFSSVRSPCSPRRPRPFTSLRRPF